MFKTGFTSPLSLSMWRNTRVHKGIQYILLWAVSPQHFRRWLYNANDAGGGSPRWHSAKSFLIFQCSTDILIFFHFDGGFASKLVARRKYGSITKEKKRQRFKRMKTNPLCTKRAEDRWQQNTHYGGSLNMADYWKWTNQETSVSSATRTP